MFLIRTQFVKLVPRFATCLVNTTVRTNTYAYFMQKTKNHPSLTKAKNFTERAKMVSNMYKKLTQKEIQKLQKEAKKYKKTQAPKKVKVKKTRQLTAYNMFVKEKDEFTRPG